MTQFKGAFAVVTVQSNAPLCPIYAVPLCPSVCPSQDGIIPKWLNVGLNASNAAQYLRDSSSLVPIGEIRLGSPNGGAKYRWGRLKLKSAIFDHDRYLL